MSIWLGIGLSKDLKKWQKLAKKKDISEAEREMYLKKVAETERQIEGLLADMRETRRVVKEGVSMGKVSNKECPQCNSTNIDEIDATTYNFFQCNMCGNWFDNYKK